MVRRDRRCRESHQRPRRHRLCDPHGRSGRFRYAADEFERQRDILDRLRVPYVVLLGNHDCLATGERIFTKIFGEVDFAFTAGDVRFVCLNTNALEFDHDTPVPNFDFLERQIDGFPAGAEKTVVVMHAKPYSEQFDNNVAKIFQQTIRRFPQLQFCLNGHGTISPPRICSATA